MRTAAIKTFQRAPYWEAIKQLSNEDKYVLIDLIKESMDKTEPILENETMNRFVKTIPQDVLQTAAALAHEDFKNGRCIPQSQIKDYIKQKMGWN